MDFLNLIQHIKTSSNEEVQQLAWSHSIDLSLEEIQLLRPLVDDISFHWLFTGIPKSFIAKVERIIGPTKTNQFLAQYMSETRKFTE